MKNIRFKKEEDTQFVQVLYARVNQYFKDNNLPKTGDASLLIKGTILLATYGATYLLLFFSNNLTQLYLAYIGLGILTIFVALNIAHDAAHGTFATHATWNDRLLYVFDLLGANGYLWQLKHVHSHHPHVNIPNMDGDIKQSNLVRIFPNAPRLSFHRYQYLYMPILYLFYTLNWLLFRDFRDFFQTNISGKPNIQHAKKEYVKLIVGKIIYLSRMIFLPYFLLPFSFPQILVGFLIFHFAASFTVTLALVSAHIGEDSVYPEPNKNGEMPSSWVRHQIVTTCDFATDNSLITHLFGGFNHHVVHHLFPNICHIHYPVLTKILAETCREFKMPYQANDTLIQAIWSHLKFLKKRSLEGKKVAYIEM